MTSTAAAEGAAGIAATARHFIEKVPAKFAAIEDAAGLDGFAAANPMTHQRDAQPDPAPLVGPPARSAVVVAEPDLYRHPLERGADDPDFWEDVAASLDPNTPAGHQATGRLHAHRKVHQRDNTISNFEGFVVPEYDGRPDGADLLGAPVAAALDPEMHDFTGDEIRVVRTTTAPTAAVQATEHTAASNTDQVTAETSLAVKTLAGAQQISMQAVEFSDGRVTAMTADSIDEAIMRQLDDLIIGTTTGTGALVNTATYLAANRVTADDASPSTVKTLNQIQKLVHTIPAARRHGPDLLILAGRRLAYVMADRDDWHYVRHPMPATPLPGAASQYPFGGELNLWGIPLVVSSDIPVNAGTGNDEDRIIALNRSDYAVFLSRRYVVTGHAEGVAASTLSTGANTLTRTMAVYRYAAFGLLNNAGGAILSGTLLNAT